MHTNTPGQIRQLFVVILTFCTPADPAALLNRFLADMGEDFAHRHPDLKPDQRTSLVLLSIEETLQRAGKPLVDFVDHRFQNSIEKPPSRFKKLRSSDACHQ